MDHVTYFCGYTSIVSLKLHHLWVYNFITKIVTYSNVHALWNHGLQDGKDKVVDKATLMAARQIVDCLVDNVVALDVKGEEEAAGGTAPRLLVTLTTLLLVTRVRPELMVPFVCSSQFGLISSQCHVTRPELWPCRPCQGSATMPFLRLPS